MLKTDQNTFKTASSGKIIKNGLSVFKRGNLLQNVIIHFVFRLSQSSEIDFSKKGLVRPIYFLINIITFDNVKEISKKRLLLNIIM